MKRPQWSVRWPYILAIFVAILLSILLLSMLGFVSKETGVGITVATAVAVGGWFIGSILNARLEVEARVHQEVMSAITGYTDALTGLRSTMKYISFPEANLIIKYKDDPQQMWSMQVINLHNNINENIVNVLDAQKKFRDRIEANELVVHRLQDMYRFTMLHNDGIIIELNKIKTSLLNDLVGTSSAQDYDKIIDQFSVIKSLIWDQQGFCTDLKYELNNLIYSKIFFVKMPRRITTDGSNTLYDLDLKLEIDKYLGKQKKKPAKKRS